MSMAQSIYSHFHEPVDSNLASEMPWCEFDYDRMRVGGCWSIRGNYCVEKEFVKLLKRT